MRVIQVMNMTVLNDALNAITHPIVSTLLLLVFFLGFTYQVFSERINLIGVLSLISIIIFYVSHLIVDNLNNLSLTFLFLAVMSLTIEFFVLGLALGIMGIIFILLSIIFITNDPLMYSLILLFVIFCSVVEVGVLVKVKKKRIPFWKRLILTDATDSESGYTSFDDRSYLLNKTGVTLAALRPAGTVKIDDERIDAVAEGSFIPGGVEVKVILVEGTRIVVRPI